MDGVLVLTTEAHWQSWLAAARPRGVDLRYDVFLSCFGRINPECVPILFGADVPADEVTRIADEKESAFREIIRQRVPLAPGVSELLTALRSAGARLAVGSSAPPENVDLVLDAGGLRASFDAVVNGTQVTRGKPAPDVFLLAAERMALPSSRCAVLEDAPAGITAAVAAGMVPIGIATTHTAEQLTEAGAIAVYPSVAELSCSVLIDLANGNASSAPSSPLSPSRNPVPE